MYGVEFGSCIGRPTRGLDYAYGSTKISQVDVCCRRWIHHKFQNQSLTSLGKMREVGLGLTVIVIYAVKL